MKTHPYKFYADTVTFIHFFWTFLLWFGTFVVISVHAYAPYQLAVLTLTVIVNIPFKNNCPLTVLEKTLRRKFDPGYENNGAFLPTYANKIFKTRFTVRESNIFLIFFYIASYSLSIYALLH